MEKGGATAGTRLRDRLDHLARHWPARLAMVVFATIILIITALLLLPFAKAGPGSASFLEALFTATSAVCVTGLTVVDTATHWTPFGHVVIAIGIQIGGLGVMTLASILGLAVSRHIGLTQRLLAASETKSKLGDVGGLLKAVVITSVSVELLIAFALFPSIMQIQGTFLGTLGHSVFMAISTFNNAGFVLTTQGLAPFVGNWAMLLPIIIGTMVGAIGFPVILNISRNPRSPKRWSLHTKITLITYGGLWVLAVIMIGALEWNGAFSGLPADERLLASLFHGTTPRSSGLSTVDIGQMGEGTWFVMDVLMFIGAGSASTGGGIKVTTFAVLVLAIIAEARGDRDTEAFGKRIPADVLRLAISAAFLGAFLVGAATLAILSLTNFPLSRVLFDVISAFATVGLSTGITPLLPGSAQVILVVLMYLGRVGTMTFAAALALRSRRRVIRLPEDRPIIG
ncbi:TrkH family potassium uptake protein [Trueperella bialowiezensis]|uniref:Ktr system potassium uptake protein B n=1 Tax=Trueperella bialowiezensis TaxID=312285 RepID=A0A448PFH3_9ACTO|nr:potassium transporter TrkG [Trueperella bialowiezensis]VEI13682.1 Ktr system potassium uptake protein B [Trueperella bialowiezensis]